MRVALAAVLFAEPDLLLLDEPTNYLDLEGTLWLEDYLARYPRTVIVISHDRDLLDNAVDHILASRQQKLTLWRGGYSAFERQRARAAVLDQKLAKKQEAQRKHLQAFVDRFRAKATKARQAQSRLKMLAKMEPIAALVDDDVRPIAFPAPEKRCRRRSSRSDNVAVGYDGRAVLSGLTLASTPTTASRCSAPTATASRPCEADRRPARADAGHRHARGEVEGRLFRAAPARRARRRTKAPTSTSAR